jgi:hypothetical protein
MRNRPAGTSGAFLSGRVLALLLASSLAGPGALGGPGGDGSDQETARLARENDLLAKRVELARGKEFYLLFDRPRARLVLMLKGAVLQEWPVRGVEIGRPRIAFFSREGSFDWENRIFSNGRLDPPRERERTVIEAPPPRADGQGEEPEPAVPIPPTPDELYPVPPRYHVRYEEGLSLEIRPTAPPEGESARGFWARLSNRLAQWWADLRAAARIEPVDRIRIRLVLEPADAASFYRALPPGTKLLVIPPDPSEPT